MNVTTFENPHSITNATQVVLVSNNIACDMNATNHSNDPASETFSPHPSSIISLDFVSLNIHFH